MSFCDLDVDSWLLALSFMSAQSLARMACSSRMGAIASHEAQQHPSLLVLKGTLAEVARDMREQLASRPTMAFLQYCSDGLHRGGEMLDFLSRRLPPETSVLGASTESLQCAVGSRCPGKPGGTVLQVSDHDAPDQVGLLLATLPEARAHVFHIRGSAHAAPN
eukprot:CAMPEP_0179322580 /NCGR_PEP_ID=MMETSP0797-20121207/59250_1 /TAXON_ID=47934 /ORGANISM="Dinophysis acuminata, Strain DAEP01" /LENGTH=162 /DNA_ID=CAMNT_0021034339 /DNA_START=30 /DNA_END=515 /DNA_ORIENTATION=-